MNNKKEKPISKARNIPIKEFPYEPPLPAEGFVYEPHSGKMLKIVPMPVERKIWLWSKDEKHKYETKWIINVNGVWAETHVCPFCGTDVTPQ